ncbi:MAG: hypothetical protein G01um101417_618 [Parcubacteria group bacterium Gr01-1014_17]|nr:MAG: hypothetical protein G01um101417_618 [Parcubacteria group bacterium Gr01-1014_17]
MTAKAIVNPLLVVLSSFIEFIFKPFVRRHRSAPVQEVETFPQFENDNRELIKELGKEGPIVEIPEESEEFMPVFLNNSGGHSPAIRAPHGIALQKSVQFLTRRGGYCSAKVVGWDGDGALILSRKNGPRFRRQLSVG